MPWQVGLDLWDVAGCSCGVLGGLSLLVQPTPLTARPVCPCCWWPDRARSCRSPLPLCPRVH